MLRTGAGAAQASAWRRASRAERNLWDTTDRAIHDPRNLHSQTPDDDGLRPVWRDHRHLRHGPLPAGRPGDGAAGRSGYRAKRRRPPGAAWSEQAAPGAVLALRLGPGARPDGHIDFLQAAGRRAGPESG